MAVKEMKPRWKQCSELVVVGLCRKEIAAKLGISRKTVDFHLNLAKKKMELTGAGDTPFLLAVVDREVLKRMEKRQAEIDIRVTLALDILLELRGH